jgi:hypothetical protein
MRRVVVVALIAACGGASRGDDLVIGDAPIDRAAWPRFTIPPARSRSVTRAVLARGIAPSHDTRRAVARFWFQDGGGEPTFVDVDRDQRVDLVLIPHAYFGLSDGYQILLRERDRFVRTIDAAGKFVDVVDRIDMVVLRYELEATLPGEARVIQSFAYRRARHGWTMGPAIYVAIQTVLPPIDRPIGRVETTTDTQLRTDPQIVDDTPAYTHDIASLGIDGFESADDPDVDRSATLGGNIVAHYAAGARGFALAMRDGWYFVAFEPAFRPRQTSLVHGAERAPPPWYVGWVHGAALERLER